MNGVNSISDVTLYDSTLEKHDCSCNAVDEGTREVCAETGTLTILNEFQRLYETRIKKVDYELEGELERHSAKLNIMEEWIRDLGEQNIMLVHTVEDLEQTASDRVKLLEEKLQHSSLVVTDNISRSGCAEEAIALLSNHVTDLEGEQQYMQERIGILENDTRGLLELIRRARTNNHWNADGIPFIDIHLAEDLPALLEYPCDKEESNGGKVQALKMQIEKLENNEKRMIEYQTQLERKLEQMSRELMGRNEYIQRLSSNDSNFYGANSRQSSSGYHHTNQYSEEYEPNVKDFQEILTEKDSLINDLKTQLQKSNNIVSMISHKANLELSNINGELEQKCKECHKLTELMSDIQNAYQKHQQMQQLSKTEMQKRDYKIAELKKKISVLEETCSNAKLNIDLKNGVIIEMRAMIKQLVYKLRDSGVSTPSRDISNTRTIKRDFLVECKRNMNSPEKPYTYYPDRMDEEKGGQVISPIQAKANRDPENRRRNLSHTVCEKVWLNENKNEQTNVNENNTDATMDNIKHLEPENPVAPSNRNHGIAKCPLYNDTQFTQGVVTIETTIRSTQNGLDEITGALINNDSIVCKGFVEKLQKYKKDLTICPQVIENLKHAFDSKNILLNDLNVVTKVQKDSITMMEAGTKELQEKLHAKIKTQEEIIGQYEKEKIELIKQNELQTQTIGHLQNAVVEAKRNIDHLGRKAVTDLQEKDETIRISIMRAEEIERQYSECFTEAAEQHYLLELQRDAISDLQEGHREMEYDKILITTSLHNAYYSILDKLKEQFDRKTAESQDFSLQNEEFQSRLSNLTQDNESMKKELQSWKSSFYVVTEVLNIEEDDSSLHNVLHELKRIKKVEYDLRNENQRLKQDLEGQIKERKYLENSLGSIIDNANEYALEVREGNVAASNLRSQVTSLKKLLMEKSTEMAKLKADYEVTKNANSIMKEEIRITDDKAKDLSQLRLQLNETLLDCQNLRVDNKKMQDELRNKDQELREAAKREIELQTSLRETEKNYSSELTATNQHLQNIVEKFSKDLETAQQKCALKNAEMNQFHELCNSYSEQINAVKQFMGHEREKVSTIEQSNYSLKQKLEAYMEQNYSLLEEKASLEENNSKIVNESEEMYNSLLDLKKKCLLKDESLASISAALTETAMSRSELCKESQYVVHCIRTWMEEQKSYTDQLAESLKEKQDQCSELLFEKKGFLATIRTLQDTNNIKYCPRCDGVTKFSCANDSRRIRSLGPVTSTPSYCNYARCMKVINISNDSTNNRRRKHSYRNETFCKKGEDSEPVLEESRDYGYQSCTSK